MQNKKQSRRKTLCVEVERNKMPDPEEDQAGPKVPVQTGRFRPISDRYPQDKPQGDRRGLIMALRPQPLTNAAEAVKYYAAELSGASDSLKNLVRQAGESLVAAD